MNKESAQNADASTIAPKQVRAVPATNEPIEQTQASERSIVPPLRLTRKQTRGNGANGSMPTKTGLDNESTLASSRFAEPSSDSKKHWPKPRNVSEFASQANAVATMVLNEEIDLEKARLYGSLARTVAQTMSTETARSRFMRRAPSTDLDDYGEEE